MDIYSNIDTDSILDRALEVLNINTDTQLAEILNVKQQTISNWRKRKSIDIFKLISVCKCDLNWLILGFNTSGNLKFSTHELGIVSRFIAFKTYNKLSDDYICAKAEIPKALLNSLLVAGSSININLIINVCIALNISPLWLIFEIGHPDDGFAEIEHAYLRIAEYERKLSELIEEKNKYKYQTEALKETLVQLKAQSSGILINILLKNMNSNN